MIKKYINIQSGFIVAVVSTEMIGYYCGNYLITSSIIESLLPLIRVSLPKIIAVLWNYKWFIWLPLASYSWFIEKLMSKKVTLWRTAMIGIGHFLWLFYPVQWFVMTVFDWVIIPAITTTWILLIILPIACFWYSAYLPEEVENEKKKEYKSKEKQSKDNKSNDKQSKGKNKAKFLTVEDFRKALERFKGDKNAENAFNNQYRWRADGEHGKGYYLYVSIKYIKK